MKLLLIVFPEIIRFVKPYIPNEKVWETLERERKGLPQLNRSLRYCSLYIELGYKIQSIKNKDKDYNIPEIR